MNKKKQYDTIMGALTIALNRLDNIASDVARTASPVYSYPGLDEQVRTEALAQAVAYYSSLTEQGYEAAKPEEIVSAAATFAKFLNGGGQPPNEDALEGYAEPSFLGDFDEFKNSRGTGESYEEFKARIRPADVGLTNIDVDPTPFTKAIRENKGDADV